MYGRRYAGRDLTFEASGGLLHSALVMRDKETGSYWPILTGAAAAGPLEGTRLDEWPVGAKMEWGDWRRLHPETTALSVAGVEHVADNPYDQYLASDSGFREASATDKRLPTKAPIWAFEIEGHRFAVPLAWVEGGRAFEVVGRSVFLYRPKGAALYASTRAFVSEGRFVRRPDGWRHEPTGARYDPARGNFTPTPGAGPRALAGLDTFWYVWSLTNPGTEIIGGP